MTAFWAIYFGLYGGGATVTDPDPTCRLGGTVTVNRLGGEVTVNRLGGKVSCE